MVWLASAAAPANAPAPLVHAHGWPESNGESRHARFLSVLGTHGTPPTVTLFIGPSRAKPEPVMVSSVPPTREPLSVATPSITSATV